ncbi:leucyl aminopeptidase family protein [Serratia fonticola]|uniref:leucyl aminopeptidase family protein n=1 Tax=Serratia fonticola TaxID=47917 RepID=UPI001AE143A9|nr:leucyl aminopeptidase family protein [Serratia fonticola]MBP1035547.1 leucyl aminopeptidase family protein [Serratia fonticola]
MINYRLLSEIPSWEVNSHVISYPGSPLQLPCNAALLQELQATAQQQTADCAYGCAPAGRVTLLPKTFWLDGQTSKLVTALRPLLRSGSSTQLIVDCTVFDHRSLLPLPPLLHFLFNLDYQLSDLGLKKAEAAPTPRIQELVFYCQPEQRATLEQRLSQAAATAIGMKAARRIADMPSDRCTPAFFASEIARQIAPYPSLSCEVLDEQQIAEQGLGLLQAVGKGADNPPRLVVIRYQGSDTGPFSAYVGKGITFDTGGLWLKGGDGMYTMKYDMCGAANVFGLMLAVAELKLPVRLVGVLALAENMIGPAAMRPGDVATSYSGLTVEINNTDAEGRLVLADGIAYASRLTHNQQPPEYVIDLATLTGAVVKALGYDLSGLMTEDENLRHDLTQAGLRSGDPLWSLPLDDRFSKQVESHIADLCNTPTNNAAISTSAAYFLSRFSPADIPWAHLDISGTALWRENGRSVASGRPIPLLIQHLLERLEK